MKRVRLQENPRSSVKKINAYSSLHGANFTANTLPANQRPLSSDPFLWSNFVTNRSSLNSPLDNSPNIPDRKFLPKKPGEGIHAKKLHMLPTLPEENFSTANPQMQMQPNADLVDRKDDQNVNEDSKTFLGTFSDATNELSSSTASAISLMVSNVRKTKNDFLAKELESRKELLQALVKDKNDTPV